jgi:hypothetical protein
MKEIIGSVIFIVSLIGGSSYTLKKVHDSVRKVALEKSAKGMPSLTRLTKSLRGEKTNK